MEPSFNINTIDLNIQNENHDNVNNVILHDNIPTINEDRELEARAAVECTMFIDIIINFEAFQSFFV